MSGWLKVSTYMYDVPAVSSIGERRFLIVCSDRETMMGG